MNVLCRGSARSAERVQCARALPTMKMSEKAPAAVTAPPAPALWMIKGCSS